MRQFILGLAVCLWLSSTGTHAQDFNKTVFPITELKLKLKLQGVGVESKFANGFCIDPECRFIGTAYHVAVTQQPRKINGQKVIHSYLATGPDDDGATSVPFFSSIGGSPTSWLKYTLSRDLAIFDLGHPLPHHRGIAFSLDDLNLGQEVDIYAYPMETVNHKHWIQRFHGKLKGMTTTGLLAFDYDLSGSQEIAPGTSGGIVVDSETRKIVGILNAIDETGKRIAMAVPVQSLADFLSKVQPYLAQSVFPTVKVISPLSADLYPKFVPSPSTGVLEQRPEEPAEVKLLRRKAQLLADSIRNLIAVQTFTWGSGNKAAPEEAAYEVQVVDGFQRFRKFPDGKKELDEAPLPLFMVHAVSTGGQWSELPRMVGTELHLKIHQAEDAVVNERSVKVFQYWAGPEDGVCRFKSIFDFDFFVINRIATVACYGEVWTDEEGNILRMSEHLENKGWWSHYQTVVTYGWLRRKGDTALLAPLTIAVQAEHNKKIYWCRGQFINYRVFSSKVKMLANR